MIGKVGKKRLISKCIWPKKLIKAILKYNLNLKKAYLLLRIAPIMTLSNLKVEAIHP